MLQKTIQRARRLNWTWRVDREIASHARSWFGTLTYRGNKDVHQIKKEVKSYLRCCRQRQDIRKYLVVYEKGGKKGRIHAHIILHCNRATQYRELPTWSLGYVHYKLVRDQLGGYLSKYITKPKLEGLGRTTQCSTGYGRPTDQEVTNACVEREKIRVLTWPLIKGTSLMTPRGDRLYPKDIVTKMDTLRLASGLHPSYQWIRNLYTTRGDFQHLDPIALKQRLKEVIPLVLRRAMKDTKNLKADNDTPRPTDWDPWNTKLWELYQNLRGYPPSGVRT